MPVLVVVNKLDKISAAHAEQMLVQWRSVKGVHNAVGISALEKKNIDTLLQEVLQMLPIHPPFFDGDDISDKPMKFFVGELIREQLYFHLSDELPYHAAVLIEQYQEKERLVKIVASIIVSRESQKTIVLGKQGSMIKKIGSAARTAIEQFIDAKVFLELHVKVRAQWRDKDNFLNEYGY